MQRTGQDKAVEIEENTGDLRELRRDSELPLVALLHPLELDHPPGVNDVPGIPTELPTEAF